MWRSQPETHSSHPPHLSHWACGAPPVETRVVTIGCTCMVQCGELVQSCQQERAAAPSTRAADSIARPYSCCTVVVAARAAAVACCTARCRAGGEPMAGMAAAEAASWLVVLSWGEMWMEEAQKSGSDRQPAGHPLGALRCVARQCAKNRLVTYQLKGIFFRSTHAPFCPVTGRV